MFFAKKTSFSYLKPQRTPELINPSNHNAWKKARAFSLRSKKLRGLIRKIRSGSSGPGMKIAFWYPNQCESFFVRARALFQRHVSPRTTHKVRRPSVGTFFFIFRDVSPYSMRAYFSLCHNCQGQLFIKSVGVTRWSGNFFPNRLEGSVCVLSWFNDAELWRGLLPWSIRCTRVIDRVSGLPCVLPFVIFTRFRFSVYLQF